MCRNCTTPDAIRARLTEPPTLAGVLVAIGAGAHTPDGDNTQAIPSVEFVLTDTDGALHRVTILTTDTTTGDRLRDACAHAFDTADALRTAADELAALPTTDGDGYGTESILDHLDEN